METIWPKILQKPLSKDAKLEKVLALYQQHPGSLVPWSRAPLKQVSELFKSVGCQRLHDQLVCYTAVFSVVTQRSSQEERFLSL